MRPGKQVDGRKEGREGRGMGGNDKTGSGDERR